ncbi:P-loop NTPase fold protein [Aeromonas salmonicida]|uniref:P-loop NTPase fold protein n=1 Tax=Aeromonas salmonicida TaxID=645 RepID=UPI00232D3B92|nr:P-loop NTPase fold protein [Aeromonas salmonicida]WCH21650.1 KAP family NTPase [Aeromonas salmonicida]
MSTELIKEQIKRFLSMDKPEVLAIKGEWGVGKTYSWKQYIEEFKNQCALKHYSYVSLFGVDSIDDIKKLVLLNSIDTHKIGQPLNLKSRSKSFVDAMQAIKISGVSVGDVLGSISQLAMTKTIICFDDLERHSKGITIKDFMGMVSYFKEEKDCKVILLLNEEAGDKTFEDYRKYKEKIVDKELHFEPTADECFDIMYADDFEFRDYVRDCCIGLNIKNKRVITKIVESVTEFIMLVKEFGAEIKKQVIHTTVVLSWCYYCHGSDEENIPEFRFVKRLGVRKQDEGKGWTKEKTTLWNRNLNTYNYLFTDEIDLAVARGIEQGFLDTRTLIPLCDAKQKELDINKKNAKWDYAWKLFHGSFNNNEDEIAEAFIDGMKDISESASASQFSSGLKLLRILGKEKEADELIDFFIKAKNENVEYFNVDSIFTFTINDDKFKETLRAKYLDIKPEQTVHDILELRRGANSYNSNESAILAKLTEDEIYTLFMNFSGEELTGNINVFKLLSGSSQDLAKKVNNVLDRIEHTSELNKYRIGKFRSE